MKIGAQLQVAMANMDKQVEMARRIGSETMVSPKEAKAEIKAAEEASGSLGKNVNVEA